MIEIDGGQGEGGGQILRTALSLSLMTGQGFALQAIRAKRPKPGLMRQHLACVHAALAVAPGATASNQHGQAPAVGDTQLAFSPAPVVPGSYEINVGSAGSCMLVLQTVMWPLLAAGAPSQLMLHGGTHNPMAPSATFLQHTAPFLCGSPEALTLEVLRHGFYPAGGGQVRVQISPLGQAWPQFDLLSRGNFLHASAQCLHAGIAKSVAERELALLQKGLEWQDAQLHNVALRSNEGPGNALHTVLQFEHITEVVSAYGEKGVSAEHVADRVLKSTRHYLAQTAPVGEHLADQLMLPMAVACTQGRAGRYWATCASEHATTNARIIEQFLPVRFGFEKKGTGVMVGVGNCQPNG